MESRPIEIRVHPDFMAAMRRLAHEESVRRGHTVSWARLLIEAGAEKWGVPCPSYKPAGKCSPKQ